MSKPGVNILKIYGGAGNPEGQIPGTATVTTGQHTALAFQVAIVSHPPRAASGVCSSDITNLQVVGRMQTYLLYYPFKSPGFYCLIMMLHAVTAAQKSNLDRCERWILSDLMSRYSSINNWGGIPEQNCKYLSRSEWACNIPLEQFIHSRGRRPWVSLGRAGL